MDRLQRKLWWGAVVSQSITAVVLVLFLAACIRSFVAARSSASAT